MIRAGTVNKLLEPPQNEEWSFIDLGFSNNGKSCGIVDKEDNSETLRFDQLLAHIRDRVCAEGDPMNLVIEAPLSMAFEKEDGNPVGRNMEKQGHKHRYWYVGAGAMLTVAADHFLQRLLDQDLKREVHLFEGFVSFKNSGEKSDHKGDAETLRDAVFEGRPQEVGGILSSNEHHLENLPGLRPYLSGIPPIVKTSFQDKPQAWVYSHPS